MQNSEALKGVGTVHWFFAIKRSKDGMVSVFMMRNEGFEVNSSLWGFGFHISTIGMDGIE